MRKKFYLGTAFLFGALSLSGCGLTSQQDVTLGFDAASAAVGVYASSPKADPKVVAHLSQLLATAQAAYAAYQAAAPGSTMEATALNAAIAALVEYEATAGVK